MSFRQRQHSSYGILAILLWLTLQFLAPAFASEGHRNSLRKCSSSEELDWIAEWESSPDGRDLLTMLFLAEDISSEQQVAIRASIAKLQDDLGKKIKQKHSLRKKSKTLFDYLHKKTFKRYRSNAHFAQLFQTGEYNCLTSTILYFLFAERFSIPLNIFVTQTHIYLQVDQQDESFVLELTDPNKGFDFVPNRQNYINFLLSYKLITRQDIESLGEEHIYHQFVQEAQTTGKPGLIAALFNNLAIENYGENNYPQALCFMRKARRFDPQIELYRDRMLMILENFIHQDVDNFDNYLGEVELGILALGDDSTVVAGLWQYINFALEKIVVQRRDYQQGLDLIHRLQRSLAGNRYCQANLTEIENLVLEHQAAGFFRRGDYDRAFDIATDLYHRDPADERFYDLLANAGVQVAQLRAQRGAYPQAYQLMDSLLQILPDYPLIREAYVNLIILSTAADLQFGQRLNVVENQLLKARNLDPDNASVRNTLLGLYHTLAMRKVKANDLYAARRFARKGLALDPQNYLLQQDLTLINDAILAEQNSP